MKSFSEKQQERARTLNRNKYIKYLYEECSWRQVDIAKKFKVSRQRIHHIVHRDHPEKIGFWGRLLDRILYFLKDY